MTLKVHCLNINLGIKYAENIKLFHFIFLINLSKITTTEDYFIKFSVTRRFTFICIIQDRLFDIFQLAEFISSQSILIYPEPSAAAIKSLLEMYRLI